MLIPNRQKLMIEEPPEIIEIEDNDDAPVPLGIV